MKGDFDRVAIPLRSDYKSPHTNNQLSVQFKVCMICQWPRIVVFAGPHPIWSISYLKHRHTH